VGPPFLIGDSCLIIKGETLNFIETLKRGLNEIRSRNPDFKSVLREITGGERFHHIPKEVLDLKKGTYLFLPGSPQRAKDIAENCFDEFEEVEANGRAFSLYQGTINDKPVASMTSHMGFGSLEIAALELISSEIVNTIIRVGTCGALAEFSSAGERIQAGDLLVGEYASFAPLVALSLLKIPWYTAHPNPELLEAMVRAGERTQQDYKYDIGVHCGGIYSKGNLYRDEFLIGTGISNAYHILVKAIKSREHLGTEMEAALLGMIAEECTQKGVPVRAGTICQFVGEIRDGQEAGFANEKVGRIEKNKQAMYSMIRNVVSE